MPESLCQLQALTKCILVECSSLVALPDALGELRALELLNLTKCFSLTALPESLGKLQALRKLLLNECSSITALPGSLGQLQTLRSLHLESCSALTALPKSFGQLQRRLHVLELAGCSAQVQAQKNTLIAKQSGEPGSSSDGESKRRKPTRWDVTAEDFMKSRQSLSKADDEPAVPDADDGSDEVYSEFLKLTRSANPSRSPSCSPPPLMHVDDVVGKPSVESSQSKVFGDSRSVKPPCDSPRRVHRTSAKIFETEVTGLYVREVPRGSTQKDITTAFQPYLSQLDQIHISGPQTFRGDASFYDSGVVWVDLGSVESASRALNAAKSGRIRIQGRILKVAPAKRPMQIRQANDRSEDEGFRFHVPSRSQSQSCEYYRSTSIMLDSNSVQLVNFISEGALCVGVSVHSITPSLIGIARARGVG